MSNRKQIVFCTDGIFPLTVGGMQRHSALLIPELARSNEFDIIVIHGNDKEVFKDLPNVKEFPLNFNFTRSKYGHYLQRCYQFSKEVYAVIANYPVTYLGRKHKPDVVLSELAAEFARWLAIWDEGRGFLAIRAAWLERATGVGKEVSVEGTTGHFEGLSADGALLMTLADGTQKQIHAGEVRFADIEKMRSGKK